MVVYKTGGFSTWAFLHYGFIKWELIKIVYLGMKRGRPFQETTTCMYHLCLDMVLAKFRGMINFLW